MYKFKVDNIHCEGCIKRIKNILDNYNNLKYDITLENKILTLQTDDENLVTEIKNKLQELDFNLEAVN